MAWITPKTDWDDQDYYNYGDLNRVENNTDYLVGYILGNIGFNPTITGIKTSWVNTDISFYNDLNKIEGNIQACRNIFAGDPLGWETPKTSWKSLDKFDHIDANRLENNLARIKAMAENIVDAYLQCGNFICGEGTEL
ncbi:hypothetical protein LPY66_18140 [Dehalobacter sp. DCM]|uniref:hypothetical protein n=1 Tax=Dehalobacter sp. DCM TaxID=2907827 RepID=UPI00308122AC|nr:hypothetical protein LPY66_18140 [Dehalobacter sp. DCM]